MFDFLKNVPLFSRLSGKDLRQLCSMVRVQHVHSGTMLFSEGDPGDVAYIIKKGWIEISKHSDGRRVVLAVRREGEVIGEMALMEDAPRMAAARAVTDSVLLTIGRQQLSELLETSPSAARTMLHTVLGRLKDTEAMLRQSEKMVQLGTLTAGISHELNNPAAAAGRGAGQLRTAIEELLAAQQPIARATFSPDQKTLLERELNQAVARSGSPLMLDGMDRLEGEDELDRWLERHDCGQTVRRRTGELLALGFRSGRLDQLEASFPSPQIENVLSLIISTYSVYSLIDEIVRSTEQISSIVQAMKSYLYHDQAPVQNVDIREGLENTLIILKNKLKKGITIKREYQEDLPRIMAYGSELNQVWTNLIDNAADAMDGRGTLILRSSQEGAWVITEVEEDGPGIPPDVQPKLFTPFFTTKGVGKGTGLGLSISANIVRKHGGSITFHSRPGCTVFTVRLPLDFSRVQDGSQALPGIAGSEDERLLMILESVSTIAVVGVSMQEGEPAHDVPLYLAGQDYQVYPVSTEVREVLGDTVYPDLESVPHPLDLVLVFPAALERDSARSLVERAADTGARIIWFQKYAGIDAKEAAAERGLEFVENHCMRAEHLRLVGGRIEKNQEIRIQEDSYGGG